MRKVYFCFLAMAVAFLLTSCLEKDNNISKTDVLITASEIINEISNSEEAENLDACVLFEDDAFKANCEKLYETEYESLSDGAIAFVESGGQADEITILKSKSDEDLSALLNKRIEKRTKDFTGYMPSEISKIQNSLVFECKGFYFLIISEKAEGLKEAIEDIIL